MNWKIIAMVFIILFFLETSLLVTSFIIQHSETVETNNCYFNVCSDYPEAIYEGGVCYCYDYDLMGKLVLAKTEYN